MGAKTDYLEDQLTAHLFGDTTYTPPSTYYVALFTAAPGETGGGTEVSGGGYARVGVPRGTANWNMPTGGNATVTNAAAITFPAPTADWGQVTHWGIFDAATAGNLLIYAALDTPKTINNGDPAPSFAAGALTYQEDT